jgi:uncharacterized protein (TIGR02246 family)
MPRAVLAVVPLSLIALLMATPTLGAAAQTPAVAAANQAPRSADQGEKQIAAIEQQDADALVRGDTAALERIWAPDLVITASNNSIRTGAEVLGFVKSGQMKLTKLDRRVERIVVHGAVAVAMGEETFVPAAGDGAGKTLSRRYTDVYLEQDGRWRLIARQATLIPAKP